MTNLLTKDDVCTQLQISLSTLNKMLREGTIGSTPISNRLVRFEQSQIEEYKRRRTSGARLTLQEADSVKKFMQEVDTLTTKVQV